MKLRPYRQHTLCSKLNEKLAPYYFGLFEILKCIGLVAYQLKLHLSAKIHNVFHASQLKRAIGSHPSYSIVPYHLTVSLELLVEPWEVRGIRPFFQSGGDGTEVLIHWKDLPDFEDSWVPFEVIQQQFPSFNLEDKVQLWAVGNVRPPIQIMFVRRGKQEARSKQRGQQGE